MLEDLLKKLDEQQHSIDYHNEKILAFWFCQYLEVLAFGQQQGLQIDLLLILSWPVGVHSETRNSLLEKFLEQASLSCLLLRLPYDHVV